MRAYFIAGLVFVSGCSAPCPPGGCATDSGASGGGSGGGSAGGGASTGGGASAGGGASTGGGAATGGGGAATGGGGGTCAFDSLAFVPFIIDFGSVAAGCAKERTFWLINRCTSAQAVTLETLEGTSPSTNFSLPSGGVLIPAGASIEVPVRFTPTTQGPRQGSLRGMGDTQPFAVNLRGIGQASGATTETFVTPARPAVDVLLVISDGPGMGAAQQTLAMNSAAFIQYAVAAAVDFRIAAVLGRADGGSRLPAGVGGPTVLAPTTPNLAQRFSDLASVGTSGSPTESCLSRAVNELRNDNSWLRPDASLGVWCLQDSLEQSAIAPGAWLAQLDALETEQVSVNASARFAPCSGPDDAVLAEAADLSFGATASICSTDGGFITSNLANRLFGYRDAFALDGRPEPDAGITLAVDSVDVPMTNMTNVVWSWESRRNAILFAPLYVPEPGKTSPCSTRRLVHPELE